MEARAQAWAWKRLADEQSAAAGRDGDAQGGAEEHALLETEAEELRSKVVSLEAVARSEPTERCFDAACAQMDASAGKEDLTEEHAAPRAEAARSRRVPRRRSRGTRVPARRRGAAAAPPAATAANAEAAPAGTPRAQRVASHAPQLRTQPPPPARQALEGVAPCSSRRP